MTELAGCECAFWGPNPWSQDITKYCPAHEHRACSDEGPFFKVTDSEVSLCAFCLEYLVGRKRAEQFPNFLAARS
jgi:hypothetical protein